MPAPHVQVGQYPDQADALSGSGSSPYVPAEGAATGSQSGSLGSAPVSRSPADGPEQPAAQEHLQPPERLQVPRLDFHSEQELTPSSIGGVAVNTVQEGPESPEPPGWQAYVAHSEQLRLSCLTMWSRVEAMQQKMVQTEKSLADERDRHATTVDEYRKRLATLSLEKAEQHESLMAIEDKMVQVTQHNQRMQEEVTSLRRSSVAFSATGIGLMEIRQLIPLSSRWKLEQPSRVLLERPLSRWLVRWR